MKYLALVFLSTALAACPFCNQAILEKQLVHETDKTVTLYCLTPATEGNLLIIPKRHLERFEALTPDEILDIQDEINLMSRVIKRCYDIGEFVLVQKNGILAGQSVLHLHFHMIPTPIPIDQIIQRAFIYRPKLTDEQMHDATVKLKHAVELEINS